MGCPSRVDEKGNRVIDMQWWTAQITSTMIKEEDNKVPIPSYLQGIFALDEGVI